MREHPPFIAASFGIGNAVARDGGYAWFGETYAPCEDKFALPLLCMDLP